MGIKGIIAAWLLMTGVAFGQPREVRLSPTMSVAAITNTIGSAHTNTTIVWTTGTYIIPNNTTPWPWRMHSEPGVKLFLGHAGSGGQPYLNDSGGTARSGFFTGYADITLSNVNSGALFSFVTVTNPSSSLVFECLNMTQRDTFPHPLIHQRAGRLLTTVHGEAYSEVYDFYWGLPYGESLYINLFCNIANVADTAFELLKPVGGIHGWVKEGNAYARFNTIRSPLPNANSGSRLFLDQNCIVEFGQMYLNSAMAMEISPVTGTTNLPIIRGGTITGGTDDSQFAAMYIRGQARLENIHFDWRTNTDVIAIDTTGLDLRSCSFRGLYNNALMSDLGTPVAVRADGTQFSKAAIESLVAVNGEIMIPVFTNAYAGTNVFLSLNAYPEQVLDVTNAMLLIPTNSVGLESGKKVRLTMVNNKATNMNVAIAALGLRTLGGPMATAVSFTVTNGRSTVLDCELIGTNKMIRVTQQQN